MTREPSAPRGPSNPCEPSLTRNGEKATMVFAALREAGVEERDVQTSNLSVSPAYDDEGRITGYEVTNSVTATLRDLEKAGAVIDAAAAVAGDDIRVHGVYFSIEDTSELVTAARADAVREARAEAEQLAEAAGLELAASCRSRRRAHPCPLRWCSRTRPAGTGRRRRSTPGPRS